MANQNDYIEEIRHQDEGTREYRALRYEELAKAGLQSPPRIYPNTGTGTWEITFAFNDAWNSYVNGTFVGCILLSQMCLEQMLGDFLFPDKPNGLEKMTFEQLLKLAKEQDLITEMEYETFNELRPIRNNYTHYRYPGDGRKLDHRAQKLDHSIMRVIADDARKTILALIAICGRSPFAVA